MALKLMYITNRPEVAQIAQDSGVDRIFVDMEYIGKASRQQGRDTVYSHHSLADVNRVRKVVDKADLLVRINPIHEAFDQYDSSAKEIDDVIKCGADLIMLPYFHRVDEVSYFLDHVNGRAETVLLLETADAVSQLDEIMKLDGIDEIHIGLNDLSIDYNRPFLFEVLADGTVERICRQIKKNNDLNKAAILYGFGGIASPGQGKLPAEYIIREHYRLGSSMVILSRAFCDSSKIQDLQELKWIFDHGINQIRRLETECMVHYGDQEYYSANQQKVRKCVEEIIHCH